MISTVDLTKLFDFNGASVEAAVSDSSYDVVFKERIGGFVHEFKHKTLFSRIEHSGVSDFEYMQRISDQVKKECVSYFNRVRSFS